MDKIVLFYQKTINSYDDPNKWVTNLIEPMKIPPGEIAFDIDGVFADTFRVFVDMARRQYGYQFHYEDITEYDFKNVIEMDEQVSDEIIQCLIKYPIENNIRPIGSSVEVLTKLASIGPLLFVTARPEKTPILRWIRRHLPDVEKDLIRLEATNTHEAKLSILLKNGIRYFVDDRLETGYLLEKAAIVTIIFEQPWNRKPHAFPIVRSWDEISDLIAW